MFSKRIISILVLLLLCTVEQAIGQTVDYTVTQTATGSPIPLEYINQNQGTALNLSDDQTTGPINFGFTFTFYGKDFSSAYISNNGVIGFQNSINGCCSGYNLEGGGNNYGIFALQTDLLNIQTSNPWYRLQGPEGSREFTIGWYNMPIYANANFRSTFEITLFENNDNILLNYGSINTGGRLFTAGIKGADGEYEILNFGTNDSLLDFTSFTLSFIPPPPPIPDFLYWNKLTDEWGTFTLTEPGVVRYGANGVYAYKSLDAGTYECTNNFWGDPIGGVFKSCELGTNELPVVNVDCALYPLDPSCIIDTLVNNNVQTLDQVTVINDVPQTANLETTTTEDVSTVMVEPTVLDLQSVLQDNTVISQTPTETVADPVQVVDKTLEPTATTNALADEVKANDLADNISKSVLEGALAIAADVTASASTPSTTNESQTSSSTAKTTTAAVGTTQLIVQEVSNNETKAEENKTDITESFTAANELLEVGRQIGKETLAATMLATEQSVNESTAQAETIALTSTDTQIASITVSDNSQFQLLEELDSKQGITEKQEETQILAEQAKEDIVTTEAVVDNLIVAANDTTEKTEDGPTVENTAEDKSSTLTDVEANLENTVSVVEETSETEKEIETLVPVDNNSYEQTENTVLVTEVQNEQIEITSNEELVAVENETIEQADTFASIMTVEIKPVEEKNDEDLELVQKIVSTEQKKLEEQNNNSAFSEDEKLTIQSDIALANAFNISPNVTNLEVAGVLVQKTEDKSDAEKRAEEVVAANAKEQEEINKNYMDADQSGLVAAMGADTDVSAYRSAMLQDNNSWYKPEDIYKNVVYKDNVRGAYFLEKGNTDTYKKMVEEQYK